LPVGVIIGKSGISFGVIIGLLTGAGLALPVFSIVALFEKRPLSYVLINGGYIVVTSILMGTILGLWK